MDNIGVHLNRTQKAFDDATNKLSTGKGNLIRQSEQFIELGVKPKATIKTKMIETIEE
jgi:DNA recombination protein RmuC